MLLERPRRNLDHLAIFENPDHPQRKAIETIPPGHVLVLDCRGDRRAASGGFILITRLKMRGAAGLVSDGPVRDSGKIKGMDFPVYCAGSSAPLNLLYHHAIDINVPIGCGEWRFIRVTLWSAILMASLRSRRFWRIRSLPLQASKSIWKNSFWNGSRPGHHYRGPIPRI